MGILSIFGSNQGDRQTKENNRQRERDFKYATESWDWEWDNYDRNFAHQLEQNQYNREFLEVSAKHSEEILKRDWAHQTRIQNYEYKQAQRAYQKSVEQYNKQLTFNNMAAATATESKLQQYEDTRAEQAFAKQDQYIAALQEEGEARLIGGRSGAKAVQSVNAALGRNIEVMNASMKSANRQLSTDLKNIENEKYGADLEAYAAKLLKPDRLPAIPKPLALPRAKIFDPVRMPRSPAPIKGAKHIGRSGWEKFMGGVSDSISIAASIYTGGQTMGMWGVK